MKSDVGFEQAISAIKILRNYVRVSEDASTELHNFGGIQSLSKCFFCAEKSIRKIAIEILAMLTLTDEVTLELAVRDICSDWLCIESRLDRANSQVNAAARLQHPDQCMHPFH